MANINTNSANSLSKQKPLNAVDAFNEFLDHFIQGKSYVLNDEKEKFFTNDNLVQTYTEYCERSQDDKGFNDVVKSIQNRDNVERETMIDIINHAVWLWALPNDRKAPWVEMEPKKGKRGNNKNEELKYNENLRNIKGVAGGGSGYLQYKTNGVRFILFLFKQIKDKADKDIKETIVNTCKQDTYDNKYPVQDGVKNLILHLCDSKKYEPIAASADKEKILKAFEDFVSFDEHDDTDDKIKKIRGDLEEVKKALPKGASFYSSSLPLMWKGESTTDLSLLQKLEYKKAMILYGPPGTGKTYTAMELAKEMIVRHFMKKYKEAKRNADKVKQQEQATKCFDVLKNIEERKKDFISYLQFHINYNYEDFIAGQIIKDGCIATKKGFIFDVIKKAVRNLEIPYVVILDEINRTDISRVFGELFTAIEKRGEDVTLAFPEPPKEKTETTKSGDTDSPQNPQEGKRLILNLPENIYFIGTMNEIDFSLERVDFALRRRFIWELHDYSEDALENIVNDRFNQYEYNEWLKFYKEIGESDENAKNLALQELSSAEDPNNDKKKALKDRIRAFHGGVTLSAFCNSCTNLNKEVEKAMGEAYHIGHAFFAEIANLYIELTKNGIYTPWKKAKKILWEISIKPTLEAYCGTMDKTEKENYLKDQSGKFYDAFFKEDPDDPTADSKNDDADNSVVK